MRKLLANIILFIKIFHQLQTLNISATTEVFNEPQDKTQFRYLHHADFTVKNGLYSYYVGTQDEKVGKFEFEVKDYDDFLNIMAYGDMGLENAQTFDLVNEAIGILDADILLHIGIGWSIFWIFKDKYDYEP